MTPFTTAPLECLQVRRFALPTKEDEGFDSPEDDQVRSEAFAEEELLSAREELLSASAAHPLLLVDACDLVIACSQAFSRRFGAGRCGHSS